MPLIYQPIGGHLSVSSDQLIGFSFSCRTSWPDRCIIFDVYWPLFLILCHILSYFYQVTFYIGLNKAEDNKWIRLYNSMFIVMNETEEIVAWQFAKKERFSFVEDLLKNFKGRLENENGQECISYFVSDTCCKWERHVRGLFGDKIKIKSDLFHAVQL